MAFINLTPHVITVYQENRFVNLEQINPTLWVADGVNGAPTLELESHGIARIETTTVEVEEIEGIPIWTTHYGDLVIVGDYQMNIKDTLIVSLACKSVNVKRYNMVSPVKVVRLRDNQGTILGCVGFTY